MITQSTHDWLCWIEVLCELKWNFYNVISMENDLLTIPIGRDNWCIISKAFTSWLQNKCRENNSVRTQLSTWCILLPIMKFSTFPEKCRSSLTYNLPRLLKNSGQFPAWYSITKIWEKCNSILHGPLVEYESYLWLVGCTDCFFQYSHHLHFVFLCHKR